jgi:hypothetical protein
MLWPTQPYDKAAAVTQNLKGAAYHSQGAASSVHGNVANWTVVVLHGSGRTLSTSPQD